MKHGGIYIHIPFCRSRCSYCDFATGTYNASLAERYVNAVAKEIHDWQQVDKAADIDTIYFGGGTPSLLSPAQVEYILGAVLDSFNLLPGAEVTMEMNPGTTLVQSPTSNGQGRRSDTDLSLCFSDGGTSPASQPGNPLSEFRKLGINRASFGAQTFDDEELRHLGRTHSSEEIRRTFGHLREAGFDNISFDLIAGLPGQSLEAWSSNLNQALALRPEHLSLYLLEVHEGTPLADQIRCGRRPQPDDDLAAEMYSLMVERVCSADYEHYEISNFCLPGYESHHNTKYWTGAPVYGFGSSAHSFDGKLKRWANQRDATQYVELVESGRSPVVDRVDLSEREARAEAVFLGLRMMRGVDMVEHRERFGVDLAKTFASDLDRLREAGLIEIDQRLLKLTKRGALLSNEALSVFV